MSSHYHREIKFSAHGQNLKQLLVDKYELKLQTGDVLSLANLLSVFKRIIFDYRFYDEDNPYIIVFNTELETCFGQRHLHITQLQKFLLPHIVFNDLAPVPNDMQCATIDWTYSFHRLSLPIPCWATTSSYGIRVMLETRKHKWSTLPSTQLIVPSSELRQFMQSFPGKGKRQKHYQLKTVFEKVSQRISDRKDYFFDLRNIFVADLQDDILRSVFKVRRIYRPQTRAFILSNCTPIRRRRSQQIVRF